MKTSIALVSAALLLGAALARRPANVPLPRPARAVEIAPAPETTSFLDEPPPPAPDPAAEVDAVPPARQPGDAAEGMIGEVIRFHSRSEAESELESIEREMDLDRAIQEGDHELAAALRKDALIVFRFRRVMAARERAALEAIRPAATPFERVMDAARVDLDVQNWPLSAIVDELRTKTGLDLRLSEDHDGYISFKASQIGLRPLLTLLLTPRNLKFTVDGVTIWIGSCDHDPDRY